MARTRKPSPSRVRYRAEHRAISAQVPNAEYEELDRIRKTENIGWREILRRSLQVPSTEEGKFTMERCIDAEERIKVLEAELKNPERTRFSLTICSHCGIRQIFDISKKEDLDKLTGFVRDKQYCSNCKTAAGPRSSPLDRFQRIPGIDYQNANDPKHQRRS
jgi:hypothetical protein